MLGWLSQDTENVYGLLFDGRTPVSTYEPRCYPLTLFIMNVPALFLKYSVGIRSSTANCVLKGPVESMNTLTLAHTHASLTENRH